MRPSDILVRKLNYLISDINLWMVPEYKDDKKEGTTMKSEEYLKDVERLKKKIKKLNENCKGLVLDDDDYELIINELTEVSSTLARNKITYLQNRYADVLDKLNTMARRAAR